MGAFLETVVEKVGDIKFVLSKPHILFFYFRRTALIWRFGMCMRIVKLQSMV